MKTFAERLNYALSNADMNQTELANKVGIDPQIVSNLSVGRTKKCFHIAQFAKYLKCNALWLECGEGSPHQDVELPEQISVSKEKLTDRKLKTMIEAYGLLTSSIEPVDEITLSNFIHTMYLKCNGSNSQQYA